MSELRRSREWHGERRRLARCRDRRPRGEPMESVGARASVNLIPVPEFPELAVRWRGRRGLCVDGRRSGGGGRGRHAQPERQSRGTGPRRAAREALPRRCRSPRRGCRSRRRGCRSPRRGCRSRRRGCRCRGSRCLHRRTRRRESAGRRLARLRRPRHPNHVRAGTWARGARLRICPGGDSCDGELAGRRCGGRERFPSAARAAPWRRGLHGAAWGSGERCCGSPAGWRRSDGRCRFRLQCPRRLQGLTVWLSGRRSNGQVGRRRVWRAGRAADHRAEVRAGAVAGRPGWGSRRQWWRRGCERGWSVAGAWLAVSCAPVSAEVRG